MANWSETTITLNGSKENIRNFKEEFYLYIDDKEECLVLNPKLHIESNDIQFKEMNEYVKDIEYLSIMTFENGEDDSFIWEDTSVYMYGEGRHCSPSQFFIKLVEKHNLSGVYTDMEGGCDFSYKIEFENGEIISEEQYDYFSQISIDIIGIEYFVEDRGCQFDYYMEDKDYTLENLIDELEGELPLFEKNGYPLERLLKVWKIEDTRKVG